MAIVDPAGDWNQSALRRPRSRWAAITDPASTAPIGAGVLAIVAGFTLMAVAWARVAGTTVIYRQFPYLLSAGLPGLALVMLGLVTVNVSIRRQVGAQRSRELNRLSENLMELQKILSQK